VPTGTDDWQVNHGDLQWSNMTAPHFMLLDWEHWGMAPRGFDLGRLLAFTAVDWGTLQRLRTFFAPDLDEPNRVGLLAGIATVKYQMTVGRVDPVLREPVDRLIREILTPGGIFARVLQRLQGSSQSSRPSPRRSL
jgi:hypothetical protein